MYAAQPSGSVRDRSGNQRSVPKCSDLLVRPVQHSEPFRLAIALKNACPPDEPREFSVARSRRTVKFRCAA